MKWVLHPCSVDQENERQKGSFDQRLTAVDVTLRYLNTESNGVITLELHY